MSIITVDNTPEVKPAPPAETSKEIIEQIDTPTPTITQPVTNIYRVQGSLAESVAVELANRLNDRGIEAKVTTESMMSFVSVIGSSIRGSQQSPTNIFATTPEEVTEQAQGDVVDTFSKIAQDNDIVIVPSNKAETDDSNIRKLVIAEHAVLNYSAEKKKKKYFYTRSSAVNYLLAQHGY